MGPVQVEQILVSPGLTVHKGAGSIDNTGAETRSSNGSVVYGPRSAAATYGERY